MSLPSPDETLIHVADRLLGLPQRRGVPLPLALLPLPFLLVVGYSIALVGSVGLWTALGPDARAGCLVMVGVSAMAALGSTLWGIIAARRRLDDARSWTPARAARYRGEALRSRETKGMERYFLLLSTISMWCAVFAVVASKGLANPAAMFAVACAGMAIAAGGHMAVSYGECAMPRDPDATVRARAAHASA